MPFNVLSPPPAALTSLSEVIPHLTRLPGLAQHIPGVAAALGNPQPISTTEPMLSVPVYILGADAILERHDLSELQPVLWSHFLAPSNASVGQLMTADTGIISSQVESVFEGPVTAEFRRELDRLQAEPQVVNGNFELAEMRVPSAHIRALWLKDRTGRNDLLVPYAGYPGMLEHGRIYSAKAFIESLRPAAEAARDQSKHGKGGS